MSVQEWVYLFSSYLEFNTHVHLLIDIFLWDLIHMYVSTWPRWIHMIEGRLFKVLFFFFHQISRFSRQSAYCSQHTSDLLFVLCVRVCLGLKEGQGRMESSYTRLKRIREWRKEKGQKAEGSISELTKRTAEWSFILLQRGECMTSLLYMTQIEKQRTLTSLGEHKNQVRRAG